MRKCVNKQKGTQRASVFGRRSNGCEKNRWPANIDTTILTSFSRNVISKEIEYVQEARRYMGKHRAKGASDVGLNCLLSGLNDRYPSDSLMSKLMNNPDSILFFYNVIQSLLSSEADVSIVVFSVQSLCRSLVKHKNCLFSMDRRVENTLVELSMSLAEHIQTTHSRNNELTSLMNACTCLLLILSSNPYRHFGGIMNDIERISKKVVFEFENGVVSLDKDANWLSYLHLDDDLHSKSSRGLELELAAFLSHVKCLDSVADIYKLLNERPTLLTLSKKSDVENLILLLATNVLCLLDGMIGAYFKISTGIERGDARVPFLHSVFTLLVESFLKWISTSEEVNLRSTSEHSTDLCVVSKFPKTIELIALSIYNDPISDEITRIITDFMSSYSRHLTIANKDSAKAAYASKKLLVSSLVISNSLSSSSKSFPEEPTRLPKNLNWFKVLTRYFQTFSSAISPLFIVHDLLGLALNFETNESRIRRSDYLLYREWTHTLNCGIIDMVLETVSRHSCAIGSSCHLSYDAPAGLGLDAALPNSDQDRRLCCSRNANTESPEGPHSRERCSSAVRELSGIDLGARDGLASEEVGTTLSGSGCHKAMNKYKNNIRHLYNCLAFAAISGSREHALLSLSAWESFSCSIKLSYSCVHRLQPLLFKLSASKYKSLYKCLVRRAEHGEPPGHPDASEAGVLNMTRRFLWSVVSLGELPRELYAAGACRGPASRLERRLSHLKTRENIRDTVRNSVFFPPLLSLSACSLRICRTDCYSPPLYSLQLYLEDVLLRLHGRDPVFGGRAGTVTASEGSGDPGPFRKDFVVALEATLHAFSAVVKRANTTLSSTKGDKSGSGALYKSEEEVDGLLQRVCAALDSFGTTASRQNWHSWDDATHGGRDSFTFDRGLCGGGASCSSGFRERERLGFTRLLFDAVVLKALRLVGEMDPHIDYCLFGDSSGDGRDAIPGSTDRGCPFRRRNPDLDAGFAEYRRLYRQLLCTLITLIGVNSAWFADKSTLIYGKALYYVFKSLRLPQEDLYFPLSLEQDHVGTLALLKLSQRQTGSDDAETMNYLVSNCVGVLESLFSARAGELNAPTMTPESYLILLVSLGTRISSYIGFENADLDGGRAGGAGRECSFEENTRKWGRYVNAVLDRYTSLLERLTLILSEFTRESGEGRSGAFSRESCNLLLVSYLLVCGLEVFVSSIFPPKYRPYSLALSTIGADKFDGLSMLDYCGQLFLARKAGTGNKHVDRVNLCCDYISSEFVRVHYPRLKLILDSVLRVSPVWFLVTYHSHASLLSCVVQLPNERARSGGGWTDPLLEAYGLVGYDECAFLRSRVGRDCLESSGPFCGPPGCGCDYRVSFLRGSEAIGKKGLHPAIALVYRSLLSLDAVRADLGGTSRSREDRRKVRRLFMSGRDSVKCACNVIPNIAVPLSLMMMRMRHIDEHNKARYAKPILSCISSLNLFSIHPIMSRLSLFSMSPVDELGKSGLIGRPGHSGSPLETGGRLEGLATLCDGLGESCGGANCCTCFEHNDLLCSLLLLFMNNLTSIKDRAVAEDGESRNVLSIVGSAARLSADSFMEYTVARCALTLLICMGMQNSNVIEVKRRITREKAAREERGRDEASLGSSLCSYDNFYFDASLLPATGRSGGHTSGFPPDRGSLDAICSYFCCACERIDAGRDSSVSMKDIVGDLIRVMDEDCGAASSDQSVGGSRFGTGLGLDFPDTDRGHSAYIDDLSGTSNEASRGVGAECGFEEGLGSDEDDAREESTGTDSDSSDDAEEDDARENGSSFSPLKLITNQRHVVTALKYLLGDFVSGDNGGNRALVLNVFNNTIWGVELVSTVFLVLMDPHCDSETFSILSDILILIKQLLDKNEFRSVLELAFLRLPIRLFIQSEIVSREFKSLKYSFSNCGYLNLDIEDYYNFNYHRVNTTNTSKNVDSIVANSINESVNLMLKENDFLSRRPAEGGAPRSLTAPHLSDAVKGFIRLLTLVAVTKTNKTKFRQIIKDFCTKPSSAR